MSTNTSDLPPGLEPEALQELANHFFKSLPGDVPKEFSLDPNRHPKAEALAEHAAQVFAAPQTLPDGRLTDNPAMPSTSGFGGTGIGVAPPTGTDMQVPNVQQAGGNQAAYAGGVPHSVAGSGASPSYLSQGNDFNAANPTTSFDDENIHPGKSPSPGSTRGSSPS